MTTSAADRNLPLIHQARDQIVNGDLKSAALTLNQANRQDPSDPRVHWMGGLLAERAGNPAGAVESMQRSLRMAPDWSVGVLEMGLMYARLNRFPEALEAAERVQQMEPRNLVVLAGCIDIARRAGHLEMAVRWLRHGLQLVPNDPQLLELLATDLHAMKRHAEAVQAWDALLAAKPQDNTARLGRLRAHLGQGDLNAAQADAAVLLAALPNDPVAQYHHELAHGRTPKTQPPEMNAAFFNTIAEQFDQHLVRSLKYQLPKQVADRLLAERPDREFHVLDLGCGTGLLGVCLGRLRGALVGVDVSTKMIEQAARHGVYDKFHQVNLLDALEATPESLYHVIAALDVFIYAGDLSAAIPNALRILVPGGQWVFSCESAPEDGADLVLTKDGRYAHRRAHVAQLCADAGFAPVQIEESVIRLENGVPVHGFVVWATKPVGPSKAKASRSTAKSTAPESETAEGSTATAKPAARKAAAAKKPPATA